MIERFSRLPHLIWNEMLLKKFHNITPWRVAEPVTDPMPRSRVYCNLTKGLKNLAAVGGLILLGGCVSRQSVLHPAGEEASQIAVLFWIMAISGAFIWAAVMGTTFYAVLGKRRPKSERLAEYFIFFGGIVFPTVTLGALLIVGLSLLPGWGAGPSGSADSCDG